MLVCAKSPARNNRLSIISSSILWMTAPSLKAMKESNSTTLGKITVNSCVSNSKSIIPTSFITLIKSSDVRLHNSS